MINLMVTKRLLVDGDITANGKSASLKSGTKCGGGSGGTIYIEAHIFDGTGRLSVQGGHGHKAGGGGGGGYVVIQSNATSHFAGTTYTNGGLGGEL